MSVAVCSQFWWLPLVCAGGCIPSFLFSSSASPGHSCPGQFFSASDLAPEVSTCALNAEVTAREKDVSLFSASEQGASCVF